MTVFKDKKQLYLAVLTLVVAVVWAGVSLVSSLRKVTIPADIERVIAPLDPGVDKELLEALGVRAKGGGR